MTIQKKLVKQVLDRDDWTCVLQLTGCMGAATVADHRADRGMGGSPLLNAPECLVAACGVCNGAKTEAHGDGLRDLIARGVRVAKAATNAATRRRCAVTAVTYPDGSVWFLLPDGGRERVGGHEF